MKPLALVCILSLSIVSCGQEQDHDATTPVNWRKRIAKIESSDSLQSGTTYLSVYSHIYSLTEHRTHDLTATVSIRNTSRTDTLFIEQAEYFDTKGTLIRAYVESPIYLAPMETIEIVIAEADRQGGSGANFMFDWKIKPNSNEPLFEGVMISTSGQQGLSFMTHGKRVN